MSFLATDVDLSRHSYYAATAARTQAFPILEGRADCDVAVVGGGLAGLSAAIELADRGFSVVLLEAKQIAWGASGRNGGQALAGLACDAQEIEQQLGMDDSRSIWAMTIEALALIQQRCQRFQIDCDWRPGFLSLAVNARKARRLQAWQAHMHRHYGHDTRWIAPADLPGWIASPRFHSGLHDARSGHLHPLKYALGLARGAAELGVTLYEQSSVTTLTAGAHGVGSRPARLQTARGEVYARHVLLAGNVYLQGLAPALAARVMPVGTYVIASEVLEPALAASLVPSQSAVCDTNFVLDYFRPTVDHRMLYGGGVSYSTATPSDLAGTLQRRMARSFPQLKHTRAEFAWGGFVDITMNRAPDFGRLPGPGGTGTSNVYYLQGFSGHGLALTGLAGKLVAEAMHGDVSRFDTFARLRHRRFPGGTRLRTPALVAGMAWYRLRDML